MSPLDTSFFVRRAMSYSMLVVATVCAQAASAGGADNGCINYQGYLLENGAPVDGDQSMTFSFFDAESGGTLLHQDDPQDVPVSEGLFNASINLSAAGIAGVTDPSQPVWLEVTVNGTPLSRQRLSAAPFSLTTRGINVDESGHVGIGTTTPATMLAVTGDGSVSGPFAVGTGGTTITTLRVRSTFAGTDDAAAIISVNYNSTSALTEALRVNNRNLTGSVGIGFDPGQSENVTNLPSVYLGTGGGSNQNDLKIVTNNAGSMNTRVYVDGNSGNVGIGTTSPAEKLDVIGQAIVDVLTIRGGADIVEGFDTSCGTAYEPGTVVVIDPAGPGKLMCSDRAYDFKVAGVVSGANGIAPGIKLGQEGVMDGDLPVAMTGRVYAKCSAENGAIRPGDRLTTANLAGHAMKATDSKRSDGAVIGKAMSSLDDGEGLVLVLVNLQ